MDFTQMLDEKLGRTLQKVSKDPELKAEIKKKTENKGQ